MIRAVIRFRDESEHVCTGRVRNREGVPWTSLDDMRRHIASIPGLTVVRVLP